MHRVRELKASIIVNKKLLKHFEYDISNLYNTICYLYQYDVSYGLLAGAALHLGAVKHFPTEVAFKLYLHRAFMVTPKIGELSFIYDMNF